MRLKQRPYNLLLLTAILLFVFGLSTFSSAIDIQMHGINFVFPLKYFIWTPSIILLTIWFIYLLTGKLLYSKVLTWTHVLITMIGCIFILTIPYLLTYKALAGMPRRYYDIGQSKTYYFFGALTKTDIVISFFLIAGQLTYLANLSIGLIKGVSRQNNR